MAQKFQYDESGSTFVYFLLSVFALILIPGTFFYWPREKKKDPNEEIKKCHCPPCLKKREYEKITNPAKGTKNLLIKLIIVLGWLILVFLAYKVSQFDPEMAHFDPFEILGVSPDASPNEIKKAYRRLSLIFHPDKDTGNEKEFVKISKAYQTLTDEDTRYNWETYGNPDGPGVINFGIALPSWIVERENSVWVLGIYALVFMVILPVVVGTWWYRSIRFSTDSVLLDTIQLYRFYFYKTPSMAVKRVIMILAASFEFWSKLNSNIVERFSDNEEVPQLIKKLKNLSEKNKERFLCFPYSLKARAIIHAHLSRIPLNPDTLEQDRRLIIAKCPLLIQEQINCVYELVVYAVRSDVKRMPTLETIENCMKLSPMIVQALQQYQLPFLQLPHVSDDNVKYFLNKKKSIKSLQHYAQLNEEDRRTILRNFSDQEFDDVMKVLGNMPYVDIQVKYEVMDDENPTEVTARALVTVTVTLIRKNMSTLFGDETIKHAITEDGVDEDPKEVEVESQVAISNKRPVWQKQKGGGGKNKNKKTGKRVKAKSGTVPKIEDSPTSEPQKKLGEEKNEDGEESGVSDAETKENSEEETARKSDDEDDDQKWEEFNKFKMSRTKGKSLKGKSKMSHSVHCPYFPQDKQEYWWVYIVDRKSKKLITMPQHVTSLVEEEDVAFQFPAPNRTGTYTFTVCLRSDSYTGCDQQKDFKLEVKEAPPEITEHPQWNFEEEEEAKESSQESDYVTDDDYSERDD